MFRKGRENTGTAAEARLREIVGFVENINGLKNPFVYGVIFGENDQPDIPVWIVPQFAQRGEDLVVDTLRRKFNRRLGRNDAKFTYLEIGANHPVAGSSTFLFYANGHRGTLVEANPSLIPALRSWRERDSIVEAAVVPGDEESVELFVANRSELSSMRSDIIGKFDGAQVVSRVKVRAVNANDLVASMWDKEAVSFLSIDVEGIDFEILESIDLECFAFDIIQIEASEHLIPGNARRIIGHLERFGYRCTNETEVNLIFALNDNLFDQKRGGVAASEDLAGYGIVEHESVFTSFDLFDTLVARRGVEPTSALKRLRASYGDLVDRRLEFDDGTRTLLQMYTDAGLPEQMLVDEMAIELDECIPIARNIDRVADGDLIVSDTYFPREFLIQLIELAGIRKSIGIYSSNLDKHDGSAWGRIGDTPARHIGDNRHSDIEIPTRAGITTELVTDSKLTDWELQLGGAESARARLLREVRLRCGASEYPTWQQIQIESNVLMLLASSAMVNKRTSDPVFLGRDCQQLFRLHRSIYGSGSYLPFSRRFAHDEDVARGYLLEHVSERQVLIDLVSTGRTWAKLRIPRDVHVIIESDDYEYSGGVHRADRFSGEMRTSEIGSSSFIWEVLNCADHGMAIRSDRFGMGWVRFAKNEFPETFVSAMHRVIDECICALPHYRMDDLVGDPREVFLLAHAHLCAFVDQHPSVFQPVKVAENENIRHLTTRTL